MTSVGQAGAPIGVATSKGRLEHLDMLRGIAAFLVLIGHVRGFVFVGYSSIVGPKLLLAPFYVIAGLGHQAVVLFFALSGFLVGGRALREIAHGRWNLPDYAVHRFARLWTALIPALVMTALFDWIGRDLLRLPGYGGEFYSVLASGPPPSQPPSYTLAAFVGNVAFLQTIAVPVFGTNGPLWSLANEFWYYFLFPFAWLALAGRGFGRSGRLIAGASAAAMLAFLPGPILLLGSIWLAGALAWIGGDRIRKLSTPVFAALFGLLTIAILAGIAASLGRSGMASDLLLGLFCAAALPFLARLPNPGGLYGRIAFWISEISFTMYVVHFPLIALLWFAVLAPVQYAVAPGGLAIFFALIAAAIAYSTAMWFLFERNTHHVRRFMARMLKVPPRAPR